MRQADAGQWGEDRSSSVPCGLAALCQVLGESEPCRPDTQPSRGLLSRLTPEMLPGLVLDPEML